MNVSQAKQSLKDVIPTHQADVQPQLLSYIDSLYQISLQKKPLLPNRSEVARYHICAYLAVEKYQNMFDLPEPVQNKIPAQPKIVDKILDDFRANLMGEIRSVSSTPLGSPRAQKSPSKSSNYSTPLSTPSKLHHTSPLKFQTPNLTKVKISSPLKRLQALRDEDSEPKKKRKSSEILNDEESPFNPKIGSPVGSQTIYKYDKKHITIPDFISFCNNFYIPADITPMMIETFLENKHKFTKKSEWLLGCGMVYAAYVRINKVLLEKKIGAKTQFQNQLFQYQKGGLMKWNMLLWCNIIEDSVKDTPWIIELEKRYIYGYGELEDEIRIREIKTKIGEGWELAERFGSMITGNQLLDSESQNKYYKTWTERVLNKL